MRPARALVLLVAGAAHVALCSLLGLAWIAGMWFVGPEILVEIWRYPLASLLFAGGSAAVAAFAARSASRGRRGRAFAQGAAGQALVNFVAFAAYQIADARAAPATEGLTTVPAIFDPVTLAILGWPGILYAGVAPLALAAILTSSDG